jgi:hypothetical protein
VFTVAEVLDLVHHVLKPMSDHYGELGRQLGGAVERRWDKAHYIGCAQGLIYAVQALESELETRSVSGPECPELAEEPPDDDLEMPSPRVAVVSPANRTANSTEWRYDGRGGTHRSQP